MSAPLGIFTKRDDLSIFERQVVDLAILGAEDSAHHKVCFQSDFPVGSGFMAARPSGECKTFIGCNVENDWFPATICAERNAATTAAREGYTQLKIVSVFCRKFPGGSPCGLCRQVLVQWGCDAVLLNVVDREYNVRKAFVGDLLPAARGKSETFDTLHTDEQRLLNRLVGLKGRSHVPYSKKPRAALFIATNNKGKRRIFNGVSDDNASYGGSALAEAVAMRSARTAGYSQDVALYATVTDPTAPNQIEGECLQVLREFGADSPIVLVGPNKSVVRSSLDELLPDSFGPEAL